MQHYALIGISGKMGSGKTTLANAFIRENPEYERHAFADKAKKIISYITNTCFDKTKYLESYGRTMGQLIQEGATALRGVQADIWVQALFADWTPDSKWIIDDVRFRDEAEEIRRRGGLLVRLTGSYTITQDGRDLQHISETELDDYQFDMVL